MDITGRFRQCRSVCLPERGFVKIAKADLVAKQLVAEPYTSFGYQPAGISTHIESADQMYAKILELW